MVPAGITANDIPTFSDREGNSYPIADINSVIRNTEKSSVQMKIDGQSVFVEITPTEAIKIIESSFN